MAISKLDLMKLSSAFDGEFDPADFTEEELAAFFDRIEDTDSVEDIRRKYFEFYDDIKDRTLSTHKRSNRKILLIAPYAAVN